MVAASYDSATPIAGFVVKLAAPDGTRHYVNICSHPTIERPLNGQDKEVDDELLRTRGLENLRVPLLTGLARTVVLPDGDSEAVCIDVLFSPAVLAVALHGDEGGAAAAAAAATTATGASASSSGASISPDLVKFVRVRLVELALKNAEEDLGYKLPRANYTLPRGVSYKGGVGGKQGQPVPMPALRKLSAAVEAQKAHEAKTAAAPGPWRSKRDAAGLSSTGKIQELASMEDDRSEKPLMKKGFFNNPKKGGALYPEGSSEGMLYGDINVAGDPLGYIPKGLRSRVNVVNTATTSADQQQKIMENYADDKSLKGMAGVEPRKSAPGNGGGSKVKASGKGGGGGGGVSKGFLNGKNGGSLYPEGSAEGQNPSAEDALHELLPSRDAIDEMAKNTNPDDFMAELAQFGSILGVGGDSKPAGAPHFGTPNAHSVLDVSDGRAASESRAASASTATAEPKPKPKKKAEAAATSAAAAAAVVTPTHEFAESDGSIVLKVSLPELSSLGEAEVEISDDSFYLHAPSLYRLQLQWPQAVSADEAKAKFVRKSHTLQVTLPLVV